MSGIGKERWIGQTTAMADSCRHNAPVLDVDAAAVPAYSGLVHDALADNEASLLTAVAEVVVAGAHVVINAR